MEKILSLEFFRKLYNEVRDLKDKPCTDFQSKFEVLGKKFYVKEYGVSLKSSSSKRPSGQSHEEVRVLKNEVETLKDVCKQQNDQVETLKDLCQTQKETIQMQQEKINAYDEKFARFEAVMSAYMHGNPIGASSNC
ncbi:hypothetical protein RHMOL_Rhmol05G0155300 [Rhododendron molle]|uniref:Uncharacterized protein n=1 Tax=Rhododendron molle TaxID=49168 RepID=A0ACC0NP72_RHOML|nr:hypothetical protein RHMOL_Rhmol05G0155300 [Rhododendron molle]